MIGAMLISASVITACGAGNTANAFQNAGTEEIAQLGSILDQNPVFRRMRKKPYMQQVTILSSHRRKWIGR